MWATLIPQQITINNNLCDISINMNHFLAGCLLRLMI